MTDRKSSEARLLQKLHKRSRLARKRRALPGSLPHLAKRISPSEGGCRLQEASHPQTEERRQLVAAASPLAYQRTAMLPPRWRPLQLPRTR